ncbi:MAG TPA: ABC transporter permease [Dongiaceae bacterium]|nr:ABC transporter permease [Dongiaceae bacterium]
MRRMIDNILRLGVKELRSLYADPVLLILMLYIFTLAIYQVAQNVRMEVEDAAIAVVDEDRSQLSRRLADAFLPPQFKTPMEIDATEVDAGLENGDFIFALTIPPDFERDLLAGRKPELQLDVDATAMSLAGNGAVYIENIVLREIAVAQGLAAAESALPFEVVVRAAFNPNLSSRQFMAIMQLTENITILAIILTGAALIREREHGTIEHLLVMPVTPFEIMCAKIWANGAAILAASALSLYAVVQAVLHVPVAGSVPLFLAGTAVYLFAATALGIFLATLAGSMPQFGLLSIPVFVVMNLLSGAATPLESMPEWLQTTMQASPSTHFVKLAQSILFRGAGIDLVWQHLAPIALIGAVLFAIALARFRRAIAKA